MNKMIPLLIVIACTNTGNSVRRLPSDTFEDLSYDKASRIRDQVERAQSIVVGASHLLPVDLASSFHPLQPDLGSSFHPLQPDLGSSLRPLLSNLEESSRLLLSDLATPPELMEMDWLTTSVPQQEQQQNATQHRRYSLPN
ncbi:MAG: hypothetical protein LBQ43_01145 [Holosporales bacterium]|jgi:hypothetical protein|nr:hypothetical protein [Holosporales bacterium]